jgi:dephospho-CoA kinase
MTPEQFDEVSDKVSKVRGDFFHAGNFTDAAQQTVNKKIQEILDHNGLTQEQFSEKLAERVFPDAELRRKQEDYWNKFYRVQG